jgi:hypothetical protein
MCSRTGSISVLLSVSNADPFYPITPPTMSLLTPTLMILLIATGYLLTIYLLLTLIYRIGQLRH